MNVKKLIEILEKYPNDMRVIVDGYEGGYDDITDSQILEIDVKINCQRSSVVFGKHSESRLSDNQSELERCLLISRVE